MRGITPPYNTHRGSERMIPCYSPKCAPIVPSRVRPRSATVSHGPAEASRSPSKALRGLRVRISPGKLSESRREAYMSEHGYSRFLPGDKVSLELEIRYPRMHLRNAGIGRCH
jgi:hypothetical protein